MPLLERFGERQELPEAHLDHYERSINSLARTTKDIEARLNSYDGDDKARIDDETERVEKSFEFMDGMRDQPEFEQYMTDHEAYVRHRRRHPINEDNNFNEDNNYDEYITHNQEDSRFGQHTPFDQHITFVKSDRYRLIQRLEAVEQTMINRLAGYRNTDARKWLNLLAYNRNRECEAIDRKLAESEDSGHDEPYRQHVFEEVLLQQRKVEMRYAERCRDVYRRYLVDWLKLRPQILGRVSFDVIREH
jgi:hypothetical protein